MALELFIKIDGVDGGTRNYLHKGWADMLSWNWNLEQSADVAGAACENMNQISILKAIGKESTSMLRLFVEKKSISAVEISAMPAVGKREAAHKYLSIVMSDVQIVSIRTDGEAEEDFFRERWILQFERVKYEVYEHSAVAASGGDGKSAMTMSTFGWDLTNNIAH